MVQPVSIVVARAKLAGRILLKAEDDLSVKVPEGDRLRIEYRFNYIEVSRKRDDFRLELTSRLGNKKAEPATYSHLDRLGVADDHTGILHQEYDAPKKGDHTLTFRATAEYVDDGRPHEDAVEGTLRVKVT